MTEDVTQDLNDLRRKVLNGEEVSSDEYARVLEALRANREAEKTRKKQSASKGTTKKAQNKQPTKSAEDLLAGIGEVKGSNG